MLTGLKMSFLVVCKCVFYRQEHNAKVGPHGTELECKNVIPTDRGQRGDEKKLGHLSSYHVYC